jgi:hypothetical protein
MGKVSNHSYSVESCAFTYPRDSRPWFSYVPVYFGRKTLWKPVEPDTMEEMGVPSMMSFDETKKWPISMQLQLPSISSAT